MNIFSQWVGQVGGAVKAADMLGVSPDAVRKWMRGDRRPRPDMALHIETVSGGAVPRDSLLWPQAA